MIELTPDQQIAAEEFMAWIVREDDPYLIIKGGAGRGKSTLTKYLLDSMHNQIRLINMIVGKTTSRNIDVHVTATTNKAAKVIAELVGEEPRTIHSMLGLRVVNDFRTGETKLKKTKEYEEYTNCLIIVDEAGFADAYLRDAILEATKGCKVLFIGDEDQLVSPRKKKDIGKDGIIDAPIFTMGLPQTVLHTNVRQGAGQTIDDLPPLARLSEQYRESVRTGKFPRIIPDGSTILHVDGPTLKTMVDTAFSDPCAGDDDYRILTWTNARTIDYNNHVRKLRGLGDQLQAGERIITNKPIINGKKTGLGTDCHATVTDVGPDTYEDGVLGRYVELDSSIYLFCPDNQEHAKALMKKYQKACDWSAYFNIKNDWGDLRPLHACTVYKSQGSTYQDVFIDLKDIGQCLNKSDFARMMYVATSRAARRVVFYGDLPVGYAG